MYDLLPKCRKQQRAAGWREMKAEFYRMWLHQKFIDAVPHMNELITVGKTLLIDESNM